MNKGDVLIGIAVLVILAFFISMVTVGTVYVDCEVVDKVYKNDPLFDDYNIVIEYEGEKESLSLTYENWLEYEIGDVYSKTVVLPITEWY